MKKIKIVLDIIMTFCFLLLMGYHITGNQVHEILGSFTFLLFIIHNILNIKWYSTLLKGKYNFRRIIGVIINFGLLLSFLGMMVSGIMISSTVFTFLNIPTTMFARSLHMVSTAWGFLFMAIHVGMHFNILLMKINKKMKNSTFEYVYYLLTILLILFGLYSFVHLKVWNDLFLLVLFKFFDYNQNPIFFYLQYFGIFLLFSLGSHYGLSIIKLSKKKRLSK